MKPHQINVSAAAVIRHLEEIDHPEESRRAGQLGSDVRKANRLDGIHFDLTFLHFVATTHFHMGTGPDANAARDFATAHALPEALGESHRHSLRLGKTAG